MNLEPIKQGRGSMSYLRNAPSRRETPQSEAIPGSGQVENSAGGYAWAVDPLTRLRRFLILGAEGATYYASAQDHLKGNVACLAECDPAKAIELVVSVSDGGLAPKNDPALFALAHYAAHEKTDVRQQALAVLPKVARTSTHLFHFAEYVQAQRGWGRSLRRAIGKWYAEQSATDLAFQAVKYRQRDGWSHRDLLRLAHPGSHTSGNPDVYVSDEQAIVFNWIAHGSLPTIYGDLRIIDGFEKAQHAATPAETARLIREYRLPREAIQTEHLTSPDVWAALLYGGQGGGIAMPLTALIRNLPTLTRVGLLKPGSTEAVDIAARITDGDALKKARIHPLQALVAHLTYAAGRSVRGSATWTPVPQIIDALDACFYASFGNLEPTGKRWLIALDVSGSMDGGAVNGVPGLTPRVASAAMAMVTMATGDPYHVIAFTSSGTGLGGRYGYQMVWGQQPSGLLTPPAASSSTPGITPLTFSPRQRLVDICRETNGLPFGGTDCALPWIYAMNEKLEIDVAVTLTDSETWHGQIHPSQALQAYRQRTGIPARSIVVGMVANNFSIADPRDAGQLDVVGFDASAPALMAAFARGDI